MSGNPTAAVGHEHAVEPDDAVLWSRSRAGDADAFGLLFGRHARTIYNYCFRRVGDWAVAEDLVSIVFLEAWRRRETLLTPGKEAAELRGLETRWKDRERHVQQILSPFRKSCTLIWQQSSCSNPSQCRTLGGGDLVQLPQSNREV